MDNSGLRELDNFYLRQEEPVQSCLLAMRRILLNVDSSMSEAWKYRMPFFCFKGKMIWYLWVNATTGEPYWGIVDRKAIKHPLLEQGTRSRMKIFTLNPTQDIPVKKIKSIAIACLELRS